MKTTLHRFPKSEAQVETAVVVGPRMTLSLAERTELTALESTIRSGLDTFMEVGQALNSVRSGKLYRESFGTFEEYCEKKWGMTARRARQLTQAAEVVSNLQIADSADSTGGNGENGDHRKLPATESQARPLASLPKEQQRFAWDEAQELAAERGEPVTAKVVHEVVDKRRGKSSDQSQGTENERVWPKANAHGVYPEDSPGVQLIEFKHKLAYAAVRVLQIAEHDWVVSYQHEYKTGSHYSYGYGLSKDGAPNLPDYEAAARSVLTLLLRDAEQQSEATGAHTPNQRKVAKLIVQWCSTQLRELGKLRPKAKKEDVGVAWKAEIALTELTWELEKHNGAETIFEQTLYFLECASRELRRIQKSVEKQPAQKKGKG